MEQNKNQATSIENFEPNVIAAFSYILPPITGIIFFLLEKKSKFVRFHALQSTLFGAAIYAINLLINSVNIMFISGLVSSLFTLLAFGLWLLLIWKAYQNEEFVLPIIGKAAQDNSGFEKMTPKKQPSEPTEKQSDTESKTQA